MIIPGTYLYFIDKSGIIEKYLVMSYYRVTPNVYCVYLEHNLTKKELKLNLAECGYNNKFDNRPNQIYFTYEEAEKNINEIKEYWKNRI